MSEPEYPIAVGDAVRVENQYWVHYGVVYRRVGLRAFVHWTHSRWRADGRVEPRNRKTNLGADKLIRCGP